MNCSVRQLLEGKTFLKQNNSSINQLIKSSIISKFTVEILSYIMYFHYSIYLVFLSKIFMMSDAELKQLFETYLVRQIFDKEPVNLYSPIKYTLENGGKRVRPLLVLLSAKSFGADIQSALPAAAAIEIFHNFTLLHDDIMDQAPIRRGKPTVHQKWDENTAILSGDTMLVWAYKMLEAYDIDIYKKLNSLLNKTAIEVCEGQQMDMDFENRQDVMIDEYIEMIRLKTAVLLGAALQFGGIIAQASDTDLQNIADFGIKLGLAFQIQDDYLDTFGDKDTFGKRIGGDILDRKKTFLYIMAMEQANVDDKQHLLKLYEDSTLPDDQLISKTMALYKKYQVDQIARNEINYYTNKALEALNHTNLPDNEKLFWQKFAQNLMHRAF